MRQTLSKGMVAAAAATSILSLYGSPALADSQAGGAGKGSPGVVSGNNVEVPVEVPVNACGNSVNAVAGLAPAFGNQCASDSGSPKHRGHQRSHESYGDDAGYGDEDSGYGDTGYGGHGAGHGDHTQPPGHVDNTPPPGHVDNTPPPGHGDHTPPPDGGHHSPSPNGGGDHTPPSYGETTPPPHGGRDHT
ncbi:chaplin, partial [Streptomyces canus]